MPAARPNVALSPLSSRSSSARPVPPRRSRSLVNPAAVMLSIDVGGSLLARDVAPNCMKAATAAAIEFVRKLSPAA